MKLGYKRDRVDPRDLRASALLGASTSPLPDSVSLEGHVAEVYSQSWNDCVANALAQAIRMCWSIAGDSTPPAPARRPIYWQARAASGDAKEDAGCYPRLAFGAVREYGFGLERFCPYEESDPFAPVPPSAYQHSYDQRLVLQYHRCSDEPATRLDEIRQALAQLHPVTIGLTIDASLFDYRGGVWTRHGPAVGGHMIAAVGYSKDGLRCVNSWGPSWGERGFFTVDWTAIADPDVCSDPYVLSVCPKTSETP